MANSRQIIANSATRHAVFTERYAGGTVKKVLPQLNKARDAVLKALSKQELTELSRAQLISTLSSLDEELKTAYSLANKKINKSMRELADYEAEFNTKLMTNATNVSFSKPSNELVRAAVFNSPILLIDETTNMSQALAKFGDNKRAKILQTVRNGVIQGQTNQQMVATLRTEVGVVQRRQAASLVQTLVRHTSTQAMQMVSQNNSDIVEEEEFVATLDSNTTETCAALDKQRFPVGQGAMPPMHWNCRSVRVPVVKPEYSIRNDLPGERNSIGSDGAESVSGRSTYNSWLKKQPAAFQDEVLGKTKGKLFRSGGLSMDKFVDSNYRPLTLEQLRQLEPMAFDKAGLL